MRLHHKYLSEKNVKAIEFSEAKSTDCRMRRYPLRGEVERRMGEGLWEEVRGAVSRM